MAAPIITPRALAVFTALFALLAVVAYTVLATMAMLEVWNSVGTAPTPSEPVTYFLTGLAGLVGGIVATAFGVSPSGGGLGGLSNLSTAGATTVQWVGAIYVGLFGLVGVGAGVTWIANPAETSDAVSNLAVVFLGMLVPIVAAWFAKAGAD